MVVMNTYKAEKAHVIGLQKSPGSYIIIIIQQNI
jgi:hypothetical protein